MTKLKPRRVQRFKRDLLSNAEKFIINTIPTYLRDILSLPAKLASASKLYNSLARGNLQDDARVGELLQFSNKVIYQETGSKNRYFLIQEPA